MLKRMGLVLILLSALMLAACETTGDTSEDAEAAQSFFPQLSGYTVQSTDNVQDAISSALAAAGVGTGNFVATGAVLKIDDFIDCYRSVGAFDARIFVEQPTDALIVEGVRAPMAGVVVVINQDRVMDNLLPCLARAPEAFSPQAIVPEPCYGNGTFEFAGDTIGYLYAATDRPLCERFAQHFSQYGGSTG
ncbi:MAG: hypothetical protein ACOCX3_01805 [Chloroflexota bacterium]